MLKSFLSLLCLLTVAVPAFAQATPGEPAPHFSAKDISGKAQSIEQYKGKIIVVEWSNPDCPFVHKHYDTGNMQKLQAYAVDKGVVWLTINSSAPEKQGNMTTEEAQRWVRENKSSASAYILDPKGTIGKLYGASTTPHMFVIDKTGKIAYAGAIDDQPSPATDKINEARNYVHEAIDALLTGKNPELSAVKAYGCSIKYGD